MYYHILGVEPTKRVGFIYKYTHRLWHGWPNYSPQVISGLPTSLIWPTKYLAISSSTMFPTVDSSTIALAAVCYVNCTVSGHPPKANLTAEGHRLDNLPVPSMPWRLCIHLCFFQLNINYHQIKSTQLSHEFSPRVKKFSQPWSMK